MMHDAAVRECWVRKDGGRPKPLRIAFTIATRRPDGDYESSAIISCKYFKRTLTLRSEDAVQALFNLPMVTHAYLLSREDHGFEVYQYDPGDLHNLNFWGAMRLTFEMGAPNKCPICREERPVPADLGPPDDIKAYIRALKAQEGHG